jgi:hypothetical protein
MSPSPANPNPPTNPPTMPRTVDANTPLLYQLLPVLQQGAEQMEPLFGANSTYQLEHFLNALELSYEWETSSSRKKDTGLVDAYPDGSPGRQLQELNKMNLGGERTNQGNLKAAMAHMAVLLGTSWHYGFHTGMCDEPNDNATDTKNPSCGQNGLYYRYPLDGFAEEGFGCFNNDAEWLAGTPTGCPVQPQIDFIVSDAKEDHRRLTCGLDLPFEQLASRDCCWWGRGMLQMTHQCDYGDYQAHWGGQGAPLDRPAVDLCANPGQVCSPDYPELRFLTGLYMWVRDVVNAQDPDFDFIAELTAWVNNKMDMRQNGNFVDRVGGILVRGDPTYLPPDYMERRHTVEAALDTIMSLAPFESPQYGNIAKCKPTVQSSIMEDEIAGNAVDGIIDSPNLAHTQCEEHPWWLVDLETPHEIYSVAIVNRHDCCFERLDHVMVELLDASGNLIEHNHTHQHDPNMEGHIVNVWTVDYEVPPLASKVRVSVKSPPGTCDFLNLAEVQVFGYCQFGDACLTGHACHLENVAQCKPVSQSSTENANLPFLAVDGKASQTQSQLIDGSGIMVAKTNCEAEPSFQVDLLSLHNISLVAVLIPGDATKMNNLIIDLIDGETGTVVWSIQHNPIMGPIGNIATFETPNSQVEHLASIVRLRLPASDGATCATLEMAEVQVYSDCWDGASCVTWPSCSYENVAQCKAATQSSTFEGGVAWKAIDGHQALSHTKCEQEPWWEVDLLGVYNISEVILYNRNDCCYDRLNGVVIELKDELDDTVRSVQHEPDKEGVIEDTWSVVFEDGAMASKVRVMVQHEPDECGFLNLQDIQVMRTCLPGEDCHSWAGCESGNVAQCKPTTQSSTFVGDVAAQAVDGLESLAHTDCELNPWWGVDLLSPRTVTHVIIHNREDCCYERLNGVLVQLFDENEKVLGQQQHSLEKDGLINTMWLATFEPAVPNVRKVFLSTTHPDGFCDFLNLAEVEVMSECLDGDACMTGFGCDTGNVAQCKPARQSSTMATRTNNTISVGVAGRAVDGHDSMSHTECEKNPWWEVNLLSMREISEVILHNRQDCCYGRLNGALIELIDDAGTVVASAQHNPGADGLIRFSWVAKFNDASASRVKVSTSHEDEQCEFLNLADVEVISTCLEDDACLTLQDCIYGNVAQCKPARQISTMEGSVANNAVNGRDALSHTMCEERPWWEVDLLGQYHVGEVVIFNRIDCCAERLSGVIVELLDHDGNSLAGVQHDPATMGVITDKWIATFDHLDFFMTSKVRISQMHPQGTCDFLNMADVQVMGICKEGDACYTGSKCEHGNVAQCKKATQSSVRNGAVAIKATDGEETVAMTKCEAEPWWMVDLETRRDVSEVVVYSRRDCCHENLNGVLVELMDSFGNTLETAQHDVDTMGVIESLWSTKFDVENVRYVKVSTQHVNGTCAPLDLAEVHVMSLCEDKDACLTGWDCENQPLEPQLQT